MLTRGCDRRRPVVPGLNRADKAIAGGDHEMEKPRSCVGGVGAAVVVPAGVRQLEPDATGTCMAGAAGVALATRVSTMCAAAIRRKLATKFSIEWNEAGHTVVVRKKGSKLTPNS